MLDQYISDCGGRARLRKALRDLLLYDDDDIPDVLVFLGSAVRAKQIFMDALKRAAAVRNRSVRELHHLKDIATLNCKTPMLFFSLDQNDVRSKRRHDGSVRARSSFNKHAR